MIIKQCEENICHGEEEFNPELLLENLKVNPRRVFSIPIYILQRNL